MVKRYDSKRRLIEESATINKLSGLEINIAEICRGVGLMTLDKFPDLPHPEGDGYWYIGYFDNTLILVEWLDSIYLDAFYNIKTEEEIRGILNTLAMDWEPTIGVETVIVELPNGSQKIVRHESTGLDTYGDLVDYILQKWY